MLVLLPLEHHHINHCVNNHHVDYRPTAYDLTYSDHHIKADHPLQTCAPTDSGLPRSCLAVVFLELVLQLY